MFTCNKLNVCDRWLPFKLKVRTHTRRDINYVLYCAGRKAVGALNGEKSFGRVIVGLFPV